jgi:hypothetical protein
VGGLVTGRGKDWVPSEVPWDCKGSNRWMDSKDLDIIWTKERCSGRKIDTRE